MVLIERSKEPTLSASKRLFLVFTFVRSYETFIGFGASTFGGKKRTF